MKTRFNDWLKLVSLGVVMFVTAAAQAATVHITATLDSSRIELGDSAQLTVTVTGNVDTQPELPTVRGLQFTSAGQSSSYQSINGEVSSSVSFLYQVTADRAGTFTIPAIRLPGGESSQPITLQVSKGTGGTSALPSPNLPPPNVQPGAADDTATASNQPAFLRVVLPKRQLYVGELMPVEIKAYFRAGMAAALNGLPTLSSDAFTINKLDDKPEQSREMMGGRPYTVVTWSTAIAAVKSGDYAVNLELPVVVTVKAKGRQRVNPLKQFFGNSGFDAPAFDDSVFDDFFGGETEKPLTLRTDLENVKVLPLPAVGRPLDFTGAVGQFKITSEAAPIKLTEGDPITLRLHVSGQGNFDRVSSHGLETLAGWKTYSPKAQFEPTDSAGFGGNKTFEQAVIPLKSGSQSVPAISFSFFDPEAKQYVTESTTPIAIEVVPGNGVSAAAVSSANAAVSTEQFSTASPPTQDLAPNKVETGNFVSSLSPVIFSSGFIALQGLPLTALAGALFVYRRRKRLSHDPARIRSRDAHTAVRAQLQNMDQALATQDAPAFFTAARQAVQERLAGQWGLPASRVTASEIGSRLNGTAGGLRDLFSIADDVVYSGQRIPVAVLQRWRDTVIQQLKDLEER
jgi:hypothetical protein